MDRTTGLAQGGVIVFDAEICAFDTICGFRLGRDRLAFTDGFFAPMSAGAPATWRLRACHGAGGRALLAANTAWAGWQFIADFVGIDRAALAAAIADGRLLMPSDNASVEEPVRDGMSRSASSPACGSRTR